MAGTCNLSPKARTLYPDPCSVGSLPPELTFKIRAAAMLRALLFQVWIATRRSTKVEDGAIRKLNTVTAR